MALNVLQAAFALAVTLGLFGVGVFALRRYGPPGLLRVGAGGGKRLSVVESLALDATRRLVLVRLDGEERLLLLGEGRQLDAAPSPAPAVRR